MSLRRRLEAGEAKMLPKAGLHVLENLGNWSPDEAAESLSLESNAGGLVVLLTNPTATVRPEAKPRLLYSLP